MGVGWWGWWGVGVWVWREGKRVKEEKIGEKEDRIKQRKAMRSWRKNKKRTKTGRRGGGEDLRENWRRGKERYSVVEIWDFTTNRQN